MAARFELDLRPQWEAIQAVWNPCHAHLADQKLDLPTAYALAMVIQELLESAVKYGSFDERRDRIRLVILAQPDFVSIEVNTPLEGDASVRQLDRVVQWIRGFQNPFEAYVERLKHVASLSEPDFDSGLGLVRVAYEGRCVLDFHVTGAKVLAMRAVYRRSAAGTAVES